MAKVDILDGFPVIYSPADHIWIVFDERWMWNGDYYKPTFQPSVLLNANMPGEKRSHFFITDGKIQYLADCEHEGKGQIIELPDCVFGEFPNGEHNGEWVIDSLGGTHSEKLGWDPNGRYCGECNNMVCNNCDSLKL